MRTAKKKVKKRPAAKPKGYKLSPRNYDSVLWTTTMCVAWSGLRLQYVLDLIHAGKVPSVALGGTRDHIRADGSVRHHVAAKFLVYSKPFREFVENLGAVGKLERSA